MKLDMSKLNQTIGRKKAVYPEKKTMNLYYKPDRTTKSATAALYILFLCVVLLALVKFLILDMVLDLGEKKDQLAESQSRLAAYEEQLADYDEVLLEYERYAATPEEAVTDRLALLSLIDSAVRSTAKVDSISISGEEMLLQFSGVTLSQTALIVQELEASELVASTQVNTAATTEGGRDTVRASVYIKLTGSGDESDGGAEGGTEGGGQ